jgi:preprotein translocase SecE subunit
LLVVRRYLQRPKTADLLIETEAEMKKVTWPTLQEVVNAAIVVVVCVVFIGAFLALADWLLGRVMRYFILGSV